MSKMFHFVVKHKHAKKQKKTEKQIAINYVNDLFNCHSNNSVSRRRASYLYNSQETLIKCVSS